MEDLELSKASLVKRLDKIENKARCDASIFFVSSPPIKRSASAVGCRSQDPHAQAGYVHVRFISVNLYLVK